jgi:hypothetical protein
MVTEEKTILLTPRTLMGDFSTGGSGLGLCVHVVFILQTESDVSTLS